MFFGEVLFRKNAFGLLNPSPLESFLTYRFLEFEPDKLALFFFPVRAEDHTFPVMIIAH
jgi:hypothetical protein